MGDGEPMKVFSTLKTPTLRPLPGKRCILITPSKWHGIHTFALLESARPVWHKYSRRKPLPGFKGPRHVGLLQLKSQSAYPSNHIITPSTRKDFKTADSEQYGIRRAKRCDRCQPWDHRLTSAHHHDWRHHLHAPKPRRTHPGERLLGRWYGPASFVQRRLYSRDTRSIP